MSVRVEDDQAVEVEDESSLEIEQEEVDETTVDEPESPEADQDEEDDEEEDRVVTFAGEDEPSEEEGEKETPGWVKATRRSNRRLESENRKLKKQLLARSTEETRKPAIELGEKPTLKGSGYDEAKFDTALQSWYDRKREIDISQEDTKKALAKQEQVAQERQSKYLTKKDSHGFKDFTESEDMVIGTLSTVQQNIIIHGAEDSALVVYALGKSPKKLKELSEITDLVEFAVRVGKLESSLSVKSKKKPSPEKRIEGKTGGLGGAGDKALDRLREKASKSGDYTEVTAYKRKMREQRSK